MEAKEILTKLEWIFRDVLENEDIKLTNSTTADDIDEWDSLTHIQLVVEIEKAFDVKFTSKEILSWNQIGDMVNSISCK